MTSLSNVQCADHIKFGTQTIFDLKFTSTQVEPITLTLQNTLITSDNLNICPITNYAMLVVQGEQSNLNMHST